MNNKKPQVEIVDSLTYEMIAETNSATARLENLLGKWKGMYDLLRTEEFKDFDSEEYGESPLAKEYIEVIEKLERIYSIFADPEKYFKGKETIN